MADNKVHFGIKNAYYSKITKAVVEGVQTITYGTPKALPGSVSLSLDYSGACWPWRPEEQFKSDEPRVCK